MENASAHMKSWEIGEVVIGLPLLAGIILTIFLPDIFEQVIPRIVSLIFGIVFGVSGAIIIKNARHELRINKQPTDPGQKTTRVVRSGIYRYSRNPMYLGAVLLYSAFTIALQSVWLLLLLPPMIFFCNYLLIKPEEKFLRRTFGKEYVRYTMEVCRWFGAKKRHK